MTATIRPEATTAGCASGACRANRGCFSSAGPADEKHPRFALQAPLAHPAVVASGRIVAVIDLDVDEADGRARKLPAHTRDDVDDGTACSARAELRRRERHHE